MSTTSIKVGHAAASLMYDWKVHLLEFPGSRSFDPRRHSCPRGCHTTRANHLGPPSELLRAKCAIRKISPSDHRGSEILFQDKKEQTSCDLLSKHPEELSLKTLTCAKDVVLSRSVKGKWAQISNLVNHAPQTC